jgi:catalase
MRVDGNYGRTLSYSPNSTNEWADQTDFREPPLALHGAAGHWDHRIDVDHFEQPGNLFRKMTGQQRQVLFDNTARAMQGVSDHIKERHIAHCTKADAAYGEGVARALGLFREPSRT